MEPKGYLVEWYEGAGYSFFQREEDAYVKKLYLEEYTQGVTITPLYTSATSPAERQIEAIRGLIERCKEFPDAQIMEIEKILNSDKS